jgi:hypothetical protein
MLDCRKGGMSLPFWYEGPQYMREILQMYDSIAR